MMKAFGTCVVNHEFHSREVMSHPPRVYKSSPLKANWSHLSTMAMELDRAVLFALLVACSVKVTEAFAAEQCNLHHHRCRKCRNQLYLSSQGGSDSRAIGDVVQGLHGGKYQFQEAGGISYEGRQFAEMGYSSEPQEEENYEDDPLPNWALKLQQPIPTSTVHPQLPLDKSGTAIVEIQNNERSWEKYYAFVVSSDTQSILPEQFVVQPRVGLLAPRGGTNEFSDRASIKVQHTTGRVDGTRWLVIGTEAERWTHMLV